MPACLSVSSVSVLSACLASARARERDAGRRLTARSLPLAGIAVPVKKRREQGKGGAQGSGGNKPGAARASMGALARKSYRKEQFSEFAM